MRVAFPSLVFLLGSLPSQAAASSWTLDWKAPSSCPNAETVREAIAKHVGADSASVEVTAVVETSPSSQYQLKLELRGEATGTRTLESDSCASLTRAFVLIVVLAIDPSSVVVLDESSVIEMPEPEPKPSPLETPREPPPPAKVTPAPPPPTPQDDVAFLLASDAAVDALWLPTSLATFSVGGRVRVRWFEGGLAVGGSPRQSFEALAPALDAPLPVTTSAFELGLDACALWRGSLAVGACLGGRVLNLGAEAKDLSETTVWTPVFTVEPGLRFHLPLGARLAFFLRGAAVIPLRNTTFVVEDARGSPAETLPLFSLRPGATFGAGFEFRLP